MQLPTLIAVESELLRRGVKYSEDQPRDERGRWVDAGGSAAADTPEVLAAGDQSGDAQSAFQHAADQYLTERGWKGRGRTGGVRLRPPGASPGGGSRWAIREYEHPDYHFDRITLYNRPVGGTRWIHSRLSINRGEGPDMVSLRAHLADAHYFPQKAYADPLLLSVEAELARRGVKVPAVDPGLYVYRPVVNAVDLLQWAAAQGMTNLLPPEELHVTVVHSRVGIPWTPNTDLVFADPGDWVTCRSLGDKGAVVAVFRSKALSDRWQEARDHGAIWDYDSYFPHVTLSYNCPTVPDTAPDCLLTLGPECAEAVDETWSDQFKELKYSPDQPRGDDGRWIPASGQLLYHATLTKTVAKIQRQGLRRFQTSNWIEAGSGARYGAGEIYAFTNKWDAIRWAAKMDWEFHKETGSGKVSVVTFDPTHNEWLVDVNDPLSQANSEGPWVKTTGGVPAAAIHGAEPITVTHVRELVARQRQRRSLKYSEDQPRVPAGSPEGGQFAGGDDVPNIPDLRSEEALGDLTQSQEETLLTYIREGPDALTGRQANQLDRMIAKEPPLDKPLRVYRGVSSEEHHVTGDRWKAAEFLSLSYEKDMAEQFGDRVVSIHLPAGEHVLDCTKYGLESQAELILPRGTTFFAASPSVWHVRTAKNKAWDESEHPREPAGTSEGGQFTEAGGGAPTTAISRFMEGWTVTKHGERITYTNPQFNAPAGTKAVYVTLDEPEQVAQYVTDGKIESNLTAYAEPSNLYGRVEMKYYVADSEIDDRSLTTKEALPLSRVESITTTEFWETPQAVSIDPYEASKAGFSKDEQQLLNRWLAGTDEPGSKPAYEKLRASAEMKQVVAKLPAYEGTVFRAIAVTKAEMEKMASQKSFAITKLSSATMERAIAYDFLENVLDDRKNHSVVFELATKSGRDISQLTRGSAEAEVIVGGSKNLYTVTKITRGPDYLEIKAKER